MVGNSTFLESVNFICLTAENYSLFHNRVLISILYFRFNGYPGNHPLVFGVKMEDCPPGGCISELATQMAIILAGKQFLFTFSQFVIPIMFSNRGSCWNRFVLANFQTLYFSQSSSFCATCSTWTPNSAYWSNSSSR